jgi:hypothetical protein
MPYVAKNPIKLELKNLGLLSVHVDNNTVAITKHNTGDQRSTSKGKPKL